MTLDARHEAGVSRLSAATLPVITPVPCALATESANQPRHLIFALDACASRSSKGGKVEGVRVKGAR